MHLMKKLGEEIELKKTKHIKESTTDPECGLFHKGKKQKCFAYSHMTICDRYGYVLFNKAAPGNLHDSAVFSEIYNELIQKFETIKNVCLDAGFNTSPICHQILASGRVPFLPYKRPMTKKGFFKKYEYVYDEHLDIYICPNEKDLHYKTTNREGYRVYESNPEDCEGCPFLSKCTQSKKHVKTIARHVWDADREEADHIRHTGEWHAIYALKGLVKNQHESLIIFSCHNLKKLGLCK